MKQEAAIGVYKDGDDYAVEVNWSQSYREATYSFEEGSGERDVERGGRFTAHQHHNVNAAMLLADNIELVLTKMGYIVTRKEDA